MLLPTSSQRLRKLLGREALPLRTKVETATVQMEAGNLGDVKGVGEGVLERRIDWGPGYGIYLGRDGEELIVLLGGGSKKGQGKDIKRAKECWSDYRRRKKAKE